MKKLIIFIILSCLISIAHAQLGNLKEITVKFEVPKNSIYGNGAFGGGFMEAYDQSGNRVGRIWPGCSSNGIEQADMVENVEYSFDGNWISFKFPLAAKIILRFEGFLYYPRSIPYPYEAVYQEISPFGIWYYVFEYDVYNETFSNNTITIVNTGVGYYD